MRHLTVQKNRWMFIAIVCVLIFIMTLCAGCEPMTVRQKWLFGGMCMAQWADYESTRKGHLEDEDGPWSEASPFLDDHPSRDQVFLLKAAAVAFFWGLGELDPDHRELYYTVGIISGAGHAIRNDHMYEERP